MIYYDYSKHNHTYRELLQVPVQQVLKRALHDIDQCIACPLLISNIQGIEIYSQTVIFRIYMYPFPARRRAYSGALRGGGQCQ